MSYYGQRRNEKAVAGLRPPSFPCCAKQWKPALSLPVGSRRRVWSEVRVSPHAVVVREPIGLHLGDVAERRARKNWARGAHDGERPHAGNRLIEIARDAKVRAM